MTANNHVDGPSLRTALVLAGGKGERLRPLTDDRPKPMALVNGMPILEHHLRWLRANGVERAVLLVGYLQDVVREYFAKDRIEGLAVECVGEDRPLGRGGAFRNGFEQAGITDATVVATNGDVLTDQPLGPLMDLHLRTEALATLLLTQMVKLRGGRNRTRQRRRSCEGKKVGTIARRRQSLYCE